jgi:GGDEF domain-containing protein
LTTGPPRRSTSPPALKARLRAGDKLYRCGGDEFAVLLRSRDGYGAQLRLERVLRTPLLPRVGVSVGSGSTFDIADRRMYRSKLKS